ncbi:hypothetical protein P7C71_g3850, partial [Lecanoromycetidae sp. Uapishka_2]
MLTTYHGVFEHVDHDSPSFFTFKSSTQRKENGAKKSRILQRISSKLSTVTPCSFHRTDNAFGAAADRKTILPAEFTARLLNVDGITSVFYGSDFITVIKAGDTSWAHVKPEVFSLITEAVTSGEQIVNTVENKSAGSGQEGGEQDTLGYDENDSEVVGMIKELLETRIRPAIQEDGGDIEFRGFENGNVMLKLRGACRTCDSSTVTLKNGIESMLMHYVGLLLIGVRNDLVVDNDFLQIEEVKGVTQVLDQEEEIAMQEFAKFEEKLKQQKGPDAVASTLGKGSLDTVEG